MEMGERERVGGGSEDVHIWICSMGTFTGGKSGKGTSLDLLAVGGGQGGDSKQKGSERSH